MQSSSLSESPRTPRQPRVPAGGRPEAPRGSLWDALWKPFWSLPATMAVASLLLGIAMPILEDGLDNPVPWIFNGGVQGAGNVLTTIAGAMISVTGLVFSITMVVLQLASQQFSPRILGTFLQSRVVQVTLGSFAGSFIYALSVLMVVKANAQAPQVSVAVAYVYVLFAVGMFLAFIGHITDSVQVSKIMRSVRLRAVASVERLESTDGPAVTWSPRPGTPRADLVLDDGRSGYITIIDSTALVQVGRHHDLVIELDQALGDFLVTGQPIGRVWGRDELDDKLVADILGTLTVAGERVHLDDLGFGCRQLLDIAVKALSPGVNDPTTAIQALHQLHVILRALVVRNDPTPYLVDTDGAVRAVYKAHSYARLLGRITREMTYHGKGSIRVHPELQRILKDLLAAAAPMHRDLTALRLQELTDLMEAENTDQPD